MIKRLFCRWFGHRPLKPGALYGSCSRCGTMYRGGQ